MSKKIFALEDFFDTSEIRRRIEEQLEDISWKIKHRPDVYPAPFEFEEQINKYDRIKKIKSSTDSVVQDLWRNLK